MADYNQNINIDLKVNTSTLQTNLAAAATEIEGVQESLEGLDTDFDGTADSIDNFADSSEKDITPQLDTDSIREELGEIDNLAENLETVNTLKNKVSDSNKKLSERNKETATTARGEAQSFENLIARAETLSDVKYAAANANKHLSSENLNTERTSKKLAQGFKGSKKEMSAALGVMSDTFDANNKIAQSAEAAAEAKNIETRSFSELIDTADTLQGAKYAVSNANEKVQDEASKSKDEIIKEKVAMGELDEKALELIDSKRKISQSADEASDSLKKLRNATERSTSSMRAATEAGQIFEDGFGALSLNIGAFTIALRNFVTQVPLLLTGLGAMAAAALGAASAFVALAGGMALVTGVGFIVYAQQLQEEVESIEDIGQSLQVILSSVTDLFEEAIEPLSQLSNITFYFRAAVEFLANGLRVLSVAVKEVLIGTDELREYAESAGQEFLSLRDAIEGFDGSSWIAVVDALKKSWALLGDEVTAALGKFNFALAAAIERSSKLLSEVEQLQAAGSNFADTLSELAEVGKVIGSGLLPIFAFFTNIVGDVAEYINSLDEEFVSGIVTMTLFGLVLNRVASGFGSILSIGPSVVGSIIEIGAEAKRSGGFLAAFDTTVRSSARHLTGFLTQIGVGSGFESMIKSINGLKDSQRSMALSTTMARAKFKLLATQTDNTGEELRDLAVQGKFSQDRFEALSKELNKAEKDLSQVAEEADLTSEELNELKRSADFDIDIDDNNKIDPVDINEGQLTVIDKLSNKLKAFTNIDDLNSATYFKQFSSNTSEAQKAVETLDTSLEGYAKNVQGAGAATGLLSSFTEMLSLKTLKAAYIQGGFIAALKSAGKQLIAATVRTASYIAAQLGLTGSSLTAKGAVIGLDIAITSLTGGLNKIIPAIIAAVAVIGALGYGAVKNSDKIVGAFKGVIGVVKAVLGIIADVLMTVFRSLWDAIKAIFEPIVNLFAMLGETFSFLGGSAEDSSGAISALATAFDILLDVLAFSIRLLGNIIGMVIELSLWILGIKPAIMVFDIFVDVIKALAGGFVDLLQKSGILQSIFGDSASDAEGLMDIINMMMDVIDEFVDSSIQYMEDSINDVIDLINELFEIWNSFEVFGIGTNLQGFEEVQLTREDGTSAETANVRAQKNPQLNYTVDKSTNIDQTVNADPEDKGKITRIAKDAIREANSFGRRTQGSQ